MSHKAQQDFIATVRREFPDYFVGKRVLEVGSLDINGSIRALFSNCDYVGIDVAAGVGVDVVCEGQNYDAPDNSYDVVISCEVMEHNPYWPQTMKNMIRLCNPGGIVIMTCATLGRREHGTARTSPDASPLTVELGWNYYRNLTIRDFHKEGATKGLAYAFSYDWESRDLYLVGFKGTVKTDELRKLRSIKHFYRMARWTSWRSIRRSAMAFLYNKRN